MTPKERDHFRMVLVALADDLGSFDGERLDIIKKFVVTWDSTVSDRGDGPHINVDKLIRCEHPVNYINLAINLDKSDEPNTE